MQNIEIKTRGNDLDRVRRTALDLGATDQGTRRDTDTYFRVTTGRLKLRMTEGTSTGTLIAYRRPDRVESRISDYHLVDVPDSDALHLALANTLGVLVTVRKSRQLLIFGSTRIHLDQVDGLGTFVELETVLNGQSMEDAEAEHRFLRERLGLDLAEIVPLSYSDLLMTRSG
jgi:predicted adenylyl cyclase CyaB